MLEVGSGVGNQTRYFADRERVIASDIEPHYLRELRRTVRGQRERARRVVRRSRCSDVDRADLRGERLDTIVCMNVLEHIEHDSRDAARLRRRCSTPAATWCCWCRPCRRSTGTLDVALHHFRRYDKDALNKLVTECGFDVREIRFLNRPGVFGWWLNSRVLRRTVLPKGQLTASSG